MNTTDWKKYKLEDLFDIYASSDKNLLESGAGKTPYVSSTRYNNGVSFYVDCEYGCEKNTITVARNGSVGSAFYHSYNYCASPDDIRILKPKFRMNKNSAIFICTLIEKEKFRYAYGRKFGTTRMKETNISLPAKQNGEINLKVIDDYVTNILIPQLPSKAMELWVNRFDKAPLIDKKIKLNTEEWKWFYYDEIFDIKKGFYNKKPEVDSECGIPFIGATDSSNGITSYYSIVEIEKNSKTGEGQNASLEDKIFEPNCITVSNDGSIGFAFYQMEKFTCSHSVNPLYLKKYKLNKYIAMFLSTLIEKEQYRWAYGRKWRPSRMPKSKIKLPVLPSGEPDWQFMEDYIKSLPYSSNL